MLIKVRICDFCKKEIKNREYVKFKQTFTDEELEECGAMAWGDKPPELDICNKCYNKLKNSMSKFFKRIGEK